MPEQNIIRPIDNPQLRLLFEDARQELIAKEFPDGRVVNLAVFLTETKQCLNEGGVANLVSAGGLVEAASKVELKHDKGALAFSSRHDAEQLYQTIKLENLLGATLYDRMRKRLESLILEAESHEEVKATP